MNANPEFAAPPDGRSALDAANETAGSFLMKATFEEITSLRLMWPLMPKQQQQEVIDRMQAKIEHAVSIVVNHLAFQGFKSVPVVIEKMAIKDVAKAAVIVGSGSEGMLAVASHIGAKGVLVFADPQDYLQNMDVIQAQADQPPLPLGED